LLASRYERRLTFRLSGRRFHAAACEAATSRDLAHLCRPLVLLMLLRRSQRFHCEMGDSNGLTDLRNRLVQ
jgi:hypothetical protein